MRLLLPALVLLLAGCGRVVLLDCDDVADPGTGATTWPATCAGSSLVLCRDTTTGERCVPEAAECGVDGEARCFSEVGVPSPTLEVICLAGDVDEDGILRTTRDCATALMYPEGEDPEEEDPSP